MQLRLPKQVVAILADTIQPGEDALVVYALTLDVDEGPFTQGVTVQYSSIRQTDTRRD